METKADVRLAVAQDAKDIALVARSSWSDAYAGIILPENQERLLARWYVPAALEEAIGQSESWFYVAVLKGEVVGFAQFMKRRENGRGELTRIYVLPEWQRLGIGSDLLGKGLAALSTHGVKGVFVYVERGNSKGIGFYERTGFLPVRDFSVDMPDQTLELLEYELSIVAK